MAEETTREKLVRLQQLHEVIKDKQREEDELAAELAASSERGVRTAMARALGMSVEALRLRYGPVKSVADAVPAADS